jgi:hypothetical protein
VKPRTLAGSLGLEVRKAQIANLLKEFEHREDVERVHALALELLTSRKASGLAPVEAEEGAEP